MEEPEVDGALAAMSRHAAHGGRLRFEPLGPDPRSHRSWLDHDLASMVENRLGLDVDPRSLSEADRRPWIERSTDVGLQYAPRSAYAEPFWLTWDGEPVGTISIERSSHRAHLGITSFYVRRERRGLGIGTTTLDAVRSVALRHGFAGLRLETSWCWRDTVAFYARRGMWVRGWKDELSLVSDVAPYQVEIAGDHARFWWGTGGGERTVAIEATRAGDRLRWSPAGSLEESGEKGWLAPGTFALHLALRGWPLITSDEAWADQERLGFSDCGGPEGLAFKIQIWEAWNAHSGWRSTAPRIEGLALPTWAELQAR